MGPPDHHGVPRRSRWKSECVREPELLANLRRRLAVAVGPVESARSLGETTWMVEGGGRRLVAKVGAGSLDESDGLRQLGTTPGAPPVPDVVLVEADLLVTTAVDQMPRTARHDEALGRSLARLHQAPSPHWGGGSSWVGACPVDPAPSTDGHAFYGARLRELSARCELEHVVGPVAARL